MDKNNKNKEFLKFNKKYLKMLPDLKDKKTQNFIGLGFTLLSLSIFGIFAINPTVSTIVQLRKQIKDNEGYYEKLDRKINNLSMLQTKYNLLQQDLSLILIAIPETPTVPRFTGQLQTLAKENNIKLGRVQTSEVDLFPSKNDSKLYFFGFSIEAQGSYENLLNFLSSLVNFERTTTIEAISISPGNDLKKEENLMMGINGSAYFMD
ncbi:MAG: type 4a pilus biogenesis protein PilO [Patescibacteria group bacterium]|nr:type 4a pilus biogenesis protein PilO [Patescibacteria group bacterium]